MSGDNFSGYRIPTMRGRGRSRSCSGDSNNGSQADSPRSRSQSTRGREQSSVLDHEQATVPHEAAHMQMQPADVTTAVMDVSQATHASIEQSESGPSTAPTGQSKPKQCRKRRGKKNTQKRKADAAPTTGSASAVDPTMEPESASRSEPSREVHTQNLPTNPSDFVKTSFDDPVKTLHDSIHQLAAQNSISFEEQVREWSRLTDLMVTMAGSIGDENDQIPSNCAALEELYKQHVPGFGVGEKTYEMMPEELDEGALMPEDFGSSRFQSMDLWTHVYIDGKLCGNPDQRALQTVCLPDKSAENAIVFQTTYVLPEYSYSYIYVKVSRWAYDWIEGNKKCLKELGTICIPLKLARANEPTIECLDEAAAAKFLGIEKCQSKAVKYTLTCTAHFDLDLYPVQQAPPITRDEIMMIKSLLNGQDQHEVTLIHPIYETTDDLEKDYAVEWIRNSIAAWHRDGGDPLSVYFENSPVKRVMTAGTVPKGNAIPYMSQVPPVSRFVDKSQYLVTFAVGKQQEKEYHERLHKQLEETTIPIKARLIPDLPTRHPVSGKPKQYLMLVDTASIPEIAHLLPRTGDHFRIIFPGVKVIGQSNPNAPTKTEEELIAEYIRGAVIEERRYGDHDSLDGMSMALREPLHSLCLKGTDDEIDSNIERMDNSIIELISFCNTPDDAELMEWVNNEMHWLHLPAGGDLGDDVDSVAQNFTCPAIRVAVTSNLWTSTTQLYKLTVPADPKTGESRLPYALHIPDPTVDDEGKPITDMAAYMDKIDRDDSYLPIRFEFVDSNKTHQAEANALQKLSAPHTWPPSDRPSTASVELFHDLITMEPRLTKPLRERLPFLAQLHAGDHPNPHLQKMYTRLSKDKHQGINALLDDARALHMINGPPGTGKTEFLMHIAGFAIATLVSVERLKERDQAADLGPKISLEAFDKLDVAEIAQPGSTMKGKVKVNANINANAPGRARSDRHQVLFVTNNNNTTNNIVSRAQNTFQKLKLSHKSLLGREPVVIRTYCLKNELKDFPRKLTSIFQGIERQGIDGVGGVVWNLIAGISDSVHAYSRQGRKMKGTSVSLAEVAAKLFEEDKTGAGKYQELATVIEQVKYNPDMWDEKSKFILQATEIGPFADAISSADFIATTHVPAADIRKYFKPDIVIEDEQPRVMESTSLILIAHFSPLARFGVGDTRQCGPLVFSAHQHKRYRPPPATYAQQLKRSLAHRWVSSGNPVISLTENFRQKGKMSDFFNQQYYNNRLKCRGRTFGTVDKDYKVAMKFIKKLAHNDDHPVNSIMVNLDSREGVRGRSARNMTNVNFVMAKVHDLLANDDFTGKIMIIAPYQGQIEAYEWELSRRCSIEFDSSNKCFTFDRSRVFLCTHQGAQGVEADVVFVDMVRSDMPGITGEPELINVVSSRAICAQVIVQNTYMLDKLESRGLLNAPRVRHLYALYKWHKEKGACLEISSIEYRVVCSICYKQGHKKKDCPAKSDETFICPVPGCMGSHHPRNCRILRARRFGFDSSRRADTDFQVAEQDTTLDAPEETPDVTRATQIPQSELAMA